MPKRRPRSGGRARHVTGDRTRIRSARLEGPMAPVPRKRRRQDGPLVRGVAAMADSWAHTDPPGHEPVNGGDRMTGDRTADLQACGYVIRHAEDRDGLEPEGLAGKCGRQAAVCGPGMPIYLCHVHLADAGRLLRMAAGGPGSYEPPADPDALDRTRVTYPKA